MDRTLGYNWDMSPVDRTMSFERGEEYLNLIDDSHDREFIRNLILNTKYVPYWIFKLALEHSFIQFVQKIGKSPFYVYYPTAKIGSEHWLMALLLPKIRELNFQGILKEKEPLPDSINLLIIDDMMYSGINVISMIDIMTYNNLMTYDKGFEIAPIKSNSPHFYIVTPFTSTLAKDELKNFCSSRDIDCDHFYSYEIPSLNLSYDNSKAYERFGIESLKFPGIYFNHKIAGPQSTYSTIYLDGRVPGKPNFGPLPRVLPSREKIEELSRLLS